MIKEINYNLIIYNKAIIIKKLINIVVVINKKIGISANGIGQKPVVINKGIVTPIIISALLFPLFIKSSVEDIFENKSKLLCKTNNNSCS